MDFRAPRLSLAAMDSLDTPLPWRYTSDDNNSEVPRMSSMKDRVLIAALFLALAAPAMVQKTTGDITGTVLDVTGGVLPGVTVTARCTDTGATRTVTTDQAGGFSLPELTVCVYKVTAELTGFKTIARDVQVAVNTVTKADFRLEVGTQSETITVQGASPLVEFSDTLNNTIDTT